MRIFKNGTPLFSVKVKGKIHDKKNLFIDNGPVAHLSGEHLYTIMISNNSDVFTMNIVNSLEKIKELMMIFFTEKGRILLSIQSHDKDKKYQLYGLIKEDFSKLKNIEFKDQTTNERAVNVNFLLDKLIEIEAKNDIDPSTLLTLCTSLFYKKQCLK